MTANSPFTALGLPERPVMLAPLAGVSDHPFRRICTRAGADLSYVEMLSATALLHENRRTYEMAKRHESEALLGVQLTGQSADEVARAVQLLDKMPYDTIDINMGCPVRKVVNAGCGSAILKEPSRVAETVRRARAATGKPLSVKIRLGWDKETRSGLECAQAAAEAGAAWITVHGRLRSDDYSVPVDLERIAEIKRSVAVPVIGNGNVFSRSDAERMHRAAGVDGVMVSRGALGNPWVFRDIKGGVANVSRTEWLDEVLQHLAWQREEYEDRIGSAVCMRKHLLWYVKGWPGARALRERLATIGTLAEAAAEVSGFAAEMAAQGVEERLPIQQDGVGTRFIWDPKFEMDRRLDRGVGDEQMATL